MRDILRLLVLFRPYWGWAVIGILVSLVSLMANIVLLSISGWFITTMALAGVAGAAVNYFTPAAIIRACAILRTGGRYAERVITHEATFRFMAEMRSRLYNQIEAMSLTQSSRYHSGDLLARLRGDVDVLEAFYIGIVMPSCVAFIALIGITISFAIHSPFLALCQLILLLIAGVLIPFIAYRRSKSPAQHIVHQKAFLKRQMVENIQAFAEMTIYGIAQPRMQEVLSLSDTLIAAQRKLGLLDGIAQGSTLFLANIGLWVALIFALFLYQSGSIDKAHIPMLALLALASFEAVLPLPLAFQSLESSVQAAKRLFSLDQAITEKPTSSLPQDRFDLQMQDISFSYQENTPLVLDHFSLHLQIGKSILLSGPSGIGKSSILHLLTGLYPAQSGKIILNDHEYSTLSTDDILPYFSVVSQSPHLFIGTIRTNLLIARPDATEEELLQACRIACFDTYVTAQEKGLDTYLGEGGATLSGGEIRRLAIARAVLKGAPCLLLDEPTESLDRTTTEKLKTNLFTYTQDKALLIISHEEVADVRFDQVIKL